MRIVINVEEQGGLPVHMFEQNDSDGLTPLARFEDEKEAISALGSFNGRLSRVVILRSLEESEKFWKEEYEKIKS